MTDAAAEVQALRAELEELRALITPPVRTNWGERTCTVCGGLADVIDLQRPEDWPPDLPWNGEGYCRTHAAVEGIDTDHPHLLRPGPKRKAAS